jgi:hypothetical protein
MEAGQQRRSISVGVAVVMAIVVGIIGGLTASFLSPRVATENAAVVRLTVALPPDEQLPGAPPLALSPKVTLEYGAIMDNDPKTRPVLFWELLHTSRQAGGLLHSDYLVERAKVPGGWLVISQFKIGPAHGLAFLPDPDHKWDGGSLP